MIAELGPTTARSSRDVMATFERYVIGNYSRYPVCLVRGDGAEVWDAEGNRYLDFFPGWGCNLLGHCPPGLVDAVREQVGELVHVPNTWYMQAQGDFAKALVDRAFESRVFFCNSGAEANEAAIKIARAHQAPRYKIVSALDSFHGRTFAAISATGQSKYQSGFGPLLPGFRHVPFGDIDALAKACDDVTAAILLEPIQGEGGVILPPNDFLPKVRQLADDRGVLLILDEVQTGMGRTGKWFAHQHYGIEPDIMTLAKALAGGIACGAMLARPHVAASLRPGLHAATFGGNPIACRAGLATVAAIESDNLLERAHAIGDFIVGRFAAAAKQIPAIRQVRGKGCMIGIEMDREATLLVAECSKRGLLVNCTHGSVIRLLPAMVTSDEQLEEGCSILEEALRTFGGES